MGRNGCVLIAATRGRPRPEMSPPFDSLIQVSACTLLEVFVHLRRFKSYFMIFIWLEIPIVAQKLQCLAMLDR